MYKKGKFSAIEEQQLADAIQAYKEVGPPLKARTLLITTVPRKTALMTRVSLILYLRKMGQRRIMRFGLHLVRAQLLVGIVFSDIIIATAVPMRPIIAIYHHVRRAYHPLRAQGKWMPSEDALLKAYVCCDV